MADSIALIVPTLTTPGPAYATQISNDLTTIATHNHDGVNNGTTIDIAAQACNEDLSVQHNNLSNVRSLELDNEPAQLTGSQDVNCLYVNQGNLGFNNNAGRFIPITSGNNLAPSPLNTFLNWTMRANGVPVTSAFSIIYSDTYNFVALDSSGGSFTGTLPISAAITPSAVGRLYVFRDATNSCGTHPVTIQVAPGSGNTFEDDGSTSFVLNTSGGYVAIYTDGLGKWFTFSQNTFQGENVSLHHGSTMRFDGTSTAYFAAGAGGINITGAIFLQNGGIFELLGSTNTVNGGVLNYDGAAAVSWVGGSTETFTSGTTETFATGSFMTWAAGSTVAANGQFNLGGTTTLSGVVNGAATFSSLSITGAALTVSSNKASTISNLGITQLYGETLSVTTVTANYVCDSVGSHYDRYLSCMVNNSSAFTITLPSSPAVGRLITIADGTGQDPRTPPGYSIVVNGAGNNIINTDTSLPGFSSIGGVNATQGFAAPGAPYPAAASIQGAGWAITYIFTGTVWAVQSANGIF